MKIERVTPKQSLTARLFAVDVLSYLHKNLKDKYRFADRLVGSAKWNTIIKNNQGYWDLDYQILLTKNSKIFQKDGFDSPTTIKNDFFNAINDFCRDKEYLTVENSTTAITLINTREKYSFDFVIIKLFPDNNEIIRRNNQSKSSINEYTWNQLPKFKEAYKKIRKLTQQERQDLIENHILPRKAVEKAKSEDDITKKSSCETFIEEVNNYYDSRNRKRN